MKVMLKMINVSISTMLKTTRYPTICVSILFSNQDKVMANIKITHKIIRDKF